MMLILYIEHSWRFIKILLYVLKLNHSHIYIYIYISMNQQKHLIIVVSLLNHYTKMFNLDNHLISGLIIS